MATLAQSILRKLYRDTRGAEIAEAAAVLPLMFMMLLGIFWFGQAFSIYGTITRAAQEGARAAATPLCTTCGGSSNPGANASAAVQSILTSAKLDPTKAQWPGTIRPRRWRRGSLRNFRQLSISLSVLASLHQPEQAANSAERIGARALGGPLNPPTISRWIRLGRLGRDDRAAQIVEFAVALPLLVVFVVGIFDFSGAFTLKQKLTNIARDAARAAAIDPTTDLVSPTAPLPASVTDAFQVVDNYLIANNLNDCSISSTATPTGLTWIFTGSGNGCVAPGLTITVNRGYYYPATGAAIPTVTCTSQPPGGQLAIISTCVSI